METCDNTSGHVQPVPPPVRTVTQKAAARVAICEYHATAGTGPTAQLRTLSTDHGVPFKTGTIRAGFQKNCGGDLWRSASLALPIQCVFENLRCPLRNADGRDRRRQRSDARIFATGAELFRIPFNTLQYLPRRGLPHSQKKKTAAVVDLLGDEGVIQVHRRAAVGATAARGGCGTTATRC